MDLNEDGKLDILSGSYSRMEEDDMAGLFQVLWGREGGAFARAKPLCDADGEPLLIEGAEDDRICTRPFAADVDGDGKLDLVVGTFLGKFAVFDGKGNGEFAPRSRWLEAGGKRMRVEQHGDPFLVDWDGDGDLDLLSGSAQGGAFLFPNKGSRTKPSFGKSVELLAPAGRHEATELGDAHLRGPSEATRLWADDVNGDGKLDLLVGDNVTLYHAVEGVGDEVARQKLAEWRTAMTESETRGNLTEEYARLQKQREAFAREDRTGFVWVLYRK